MVTTTKLLTNVAERKNLRPTIQPWRCLLLGFVATRLALVLTGVLTLSLFPLDTKQLPGDYHRPQEALKPLEMWSRWDAEWYLAIAEQGYGGKVAADYDMRPALFPLFPMLAALVRVFVRHSIVAGLLVSNAALLWFLFALWRLIALDYGEAAATRAVWLYLLFPSSLFLSGIYSESVMVATTVGATLAARQSRWAWAGLLAALALLSRPVGVLVLILLGIEYLTACDYSFRRMQVREVCWLVIPSALALGVYCYFAAEAFGHPLAFMAMQQAVRGGMGWPWQSFVRFWEEGPHWHGVVNSIYDASLASLALLSLPFIFNRLRLSYGCFAAVSVLIALSTSLFSFSRILLGVFPCFILLAVVITKRAVWFPLLVICGILLGVFTVMFTRWQWVA